MFDFREHCGHERYVIVARFRTFLENILLMMLSRNWPSLINIFRDQGQKMKIWVCTLLCFALFGCSSSSDGTGSSGTPITGVFIDSAVTGITYSTASQSGTTNTSGEFTYIDGESVTFSIGSLNLPSVAAKSVVTPVDMSATGNVDNNGH